MWKKIIVIVLVLISYIVICNIIYNNFTIEKNKISTSINIPNPKKVTKIIPKENSIGKLTIDKISLNKKLYPINSKENNIEKNITILPGSIEPSNENSIMFIAAHSGTGKKAYFKELHKMKKNDSIILEYKNIRYTYIIKNIWETKKLGTISVPKENINQLILTTCSMKDKENQLIINSVLTKKESQTLYFFNISTAFCNCKSLS